MGAPPPSGVAVTLTSFALAAFEPFDVKGLFSGQAEAPGAFARHELKGEHPHADQVRAMDPLEALGDDRLDSEEIRALIRDCGGSAVFADEGEHAIVLAEAPAELEALRRLLVGEYANRSVRVSRLPSGRFRVEGEPRARPIDPPALQAAAQGLAISCDRFVEIRGPATFGFTTERVAKGEFGPERAAMALGQELFNAPDTVVTHLGLEPFTEEGSLFFAYEGSETVWDAANKGVSCITVRDIAEYGRILAAIRRGE